MAVNNSDSLTASQVDTNEAVDTSISTRGHLTNEDYGITTPAAQENSEPSYPGYTIAYTGQNTPNTPVTYSDRSFSFPGNIQISCPSCSSFTPCFNCQPNQNMAQVRFLNASTAGNVVNISVDNTNYAINSRFGTISNYDRISDGFHTITARTSAGRSILLQQSFPFSAGQKYTMVLVDAASGGLTMTQVPSTGCNNMAFNTGCYRVANMSYPNSNFDILLYSRDAIFRNVSFRDVTSYKQATAGSYQFYITNASNYMLIRELPALVIGGIISNTAFNNEPILSYQARINAGSKYTSYIIGNMWTNYNLQVLTVED